METRKRKTVIQSLTFGLLGKVLRFSARRQKLQKDIKTPFNMTQRQWIANKINVPVEQITDDAICKHLEEISELNVEIESKKNQILFDTDKEKWRASIDERIQKMIT